VAGGKGVLQEEDGVRLPAGGRPVTPEWDGAGVEILFVASVSVVAPDPVESRRLYVDAFGLPLERL